MSGLVASSIEDLLRRLGEAESTIAAMLSEQIDAVVAVPGDTPVLLSKAQAALRESEERYRQIVEATSDGIVKTDTKWIVRFVNRRFADMLGYAAHEMIDQPLSAFMSAAAYARATETTRARLAGMTDPVDATFRHKSGRDVSVNVAGSLIRDDAGTYVGSLGVVRDVTLQKRMQSQLIASDRMASIGTLAAGVAHEINNPLSAVIANIGYVVDNLAPMFRGEASQMRLGAGDNWALDEIKAPLDDAREAADRVRRIVRDLKVFSRSPAEEDKGPVDVVATMESSLRMAWNEIRHRARLVKTFAPVPHVFANEARLGQVFLNLIVNAAQALPAGGAEANEIRVATSVAGGRVVVAVSDTGAGIAPEIIERIFDAFFTTKPVGVGSGLGLAICQRLVTDMQGELSVDSVVGEGTTFRVSLPVSAAAKAPTFAASTPPAAPAAKRGRILVVDDEMALVNVVKRILGKDHDIVPLISARQALALVERGERFDLLLCDLMMPDMTGMDLHCELLRVAPDQAARMLFMTGGAFTDKARRFLADPSREHIEKPFDPRNLRAMVQRYLRAPSD